MSQMSLVAGQQNGWAEVPHSPQPSPRVSGRELHPSKQLSKLGAVVLPLLPPCASLLYPHPTLQSPPKTRKWPGPDPWLRPIPPGRCHPIPGIYCLSPRSPEQADVGDGLAQGRQLRLDLSHALVQRLGGGGQDGGGLFSATLLVDVALD